MRQKLVSRALRYRPYIRQTFSDDVNRIIKFAVGISHHCGAQGRIQKKKLLGRIMNRSRALTYTKKINGTRQIYFGGALFSVFFQTFFNIGLWYPGWKVVPLAGPWAGMPLLGSWCSWQACGSLVPLEGTVVPLTTP